MCCLALERANRDVKEHLLMSVVTCFLSVVIEFVRNAINGQKGGLVALPKSCIKHFGQYLIPMLVCYSLLVNERILITLKVL